MPGCNVFTCFSFRFWQISYWIFQLFPLGRSHLLAFCLISVFSSFYFFSYLCIYTYIFFFRFHLWSAPHMDSQLDICFTVHLSSNWILLVSSQFSFPLLTGSSSIHGVCATYLPSVIDTGRKNKKMKLNATECEIAKSHKGVTKRFWYATEASTGQWWNMSKTWNLFIILTSFRSGCKLASIKRAWLEALNERNVYSQCFLSTIFNGYIHFLLKFIFFAINMGICIPIN